MSKVVLEDLMRQAELLSIDEKLRLMEYLLAWARATCQAEKPRRKWRELCGLAPYPLAGEDAQAWVTRTRHESDEQRSRQWEQPR